MTTKSPNQLALLLGAATLAVSCPWAELPPHEHEDAGGPDVTCVAPEGGWGKVGGSHG